MKRFNLDNQYDSALMFDWIDTSNYASENYDGLVSWAQNDLGLTLEPIGKSEDGDYDIFGTEIVENPSNPYIVVIANMHGWERGGSHYGSEFMRRMKNSSFPMAEHNNLKRRFNYFFILSANPWGYDRGIYENSNNINANRNFDYNFLEEGQGVEPFSEAEAAIVRDVILSKKPVAVIDIHQRGGGSKTAIGIGKGNSNHDIWYRDVIESLKISDPEIEVEPFWQNSNATLRNWVSYVKNEKYNTNTLGILLEVKNAVWGEDEDRQELKTYYGISALLVLSLHIREWFEKQTLITE